MKPSDFDRQSRARITSYNVCYTKLLRFGKEISGMDVVNQIKGTATTTKSGHQDGPAGDIIIEKAEITE